MRILGFIKRNSSEFHDPTTFKSLYVSLVRAHLQYCSIIWNPSLIADIVKIEKFKKMLNVFCFLTLIGMLKIQLASAVV